MKLKSSTYDILSYIGKILLPALAIAYSSLADLYNLPYKTQITETIGIVAVFILNAFLQESSKIYYQSKKELQEELNDWNTGDKG